MRGVGWGRSRRCVRLRRDVRGSRPYPGSLSGLSGGDGAGPEALTGVAPADQVVGPALRPPPYPHVLQTVEGTHSRGRRYRGRCSRSRWGGVEAGGAEGCRSRGRAEPRRSSRWSRCAAPLAAGQAWPANVPSAVSPYASYQNRNRCGDGRTRRAAADCARRPPRGCCHHGRGSNTSGPRRSPSRGFCQPGLGRERKTRHECTGAIRLVPQHALEGYASEVSVTPGETLQLHVSTSPRRSGTRSRSSASGGTAAGVDISSHAVSGMSRQPRRRPAGDATPRPGHGSSPPSPWPVTDLGTGRHGLDERLLPGEPRRWPRGRLAGRGSFVPFVVRAPEGPQHVGDQSPGLRSTPGRPTTRGADAAFYWNHTGIGDDHASFDRPL